MSTPTILPGGNLLLSASTEEGYQNAVATMVAWIDAKMERVKVEQDELQENIEVAKRNKWRTSALKRAATRTKGRWLFYRKLKAAIQAGYHIIPAIPNLEVIAVRRKEGKAPRKSKIMHSRWESALSVPATRLDVGEGQYAPPNLPTTVTPIGQTAKGVDRYEYTTDGTYDDVEFPVAVVKPEIMEETSRAMTLRIFDSVAVMPPSRHKGDPLVVGVIEHPTNPYHDGFYFGIAWWFNTRDIDI